MIKKVIIDKEYIKNLNDFNDRYDFLKENIIKLKNISNILKYDLEKEVLKSIILRIFWIYEYFFRVLVNDFSCQKTYFKNLLESIVKYENQRPLNIKIFLKKLKIENEIFLTELLNNLDDISSLDFNDTMNKFKINKNWDFNLIKSDKNYEDLFYIVDILLRKMRNLIAHWQIEFDKNYKNNKHIEENTAKKIKVSELITIEYIEFLEKNIFWIIDKILNWLFKKIYNNEDVLIIPSWYTYDFIKNTNVYFCQKWRFFQDKKYIWFYKEWKIKAYCIYEKIDFKSLSTDIKNNYKKKFWKSNINDFYKLKDFTEIDFDWIDSWRSPVQKQQYISLKDLLK